MPMLASVLLLVCQTNGIGLYNQCVVTPPVTPQQISACTTLKSTYLLCLQQLNLPYPLINSLDPDPYSGTPFTPCTYETGHLILPGICLTLP